MCLYWTLCVFIPSFSSVMFCWKYDLKAIRILTALRSNGISLFYTRKWAEHSAGILIHERELFIRRVRKRKITRPVCFRKAGQILLRLWSLLLDTNTAFLGLSKIMPWLFQRKKKMPTNHTDKARFIVCIETGILTLLFPLQTTAF